MAGETDRLVQLCREAAALHDPSEYDVVVASGEQVTAGLLAMTLQNMGVNARSFMGWQLVRASGVHGNARVEAVESATLDEALSKAARSPSSRASRACRPTAGWRRSAAADRTRRRSPSPPASRPTAATSTPTSTGSTPPTRASCPRRASWTRSRSRKCSSWRASAPRCCRCARSGSRCARICRFACYRRSRTSPGTDIVAELSGEGMERNLIAGIAADRNEARITLTGVPDQPGTVAAVITPLAEAGIQVDMIVHAATPNSGSSDLTFTVPRASLAQAMAVIEQRKDAIGYAEPDPRTMRSPRSASSASASAPTPSSPRRCSRCSPSGRSTCSRCRSSEIKVSALDRRRRPRPRRARAPHRVRTGRGGRRHERRRTDRRAARGPPDRRPRAPQGADAPRHRVPRLRRRDHRRRDELGFASATSSPPSPTPAASE